MKQRRTDDDNDHCIVIEERMNKCREEVAENRELTALREQLHTATAAAASAAQRTLKIRESLVVRANDPHLCFCLFMVSIFFCFFTVESSNQCPSLSLNCIDLSSVW
jgi:hypothetical protein